jgi:ABC-type antimicrobial peptide transport system permease subunit
LSRRRFNLVLLSIFAAIALTLTAVGVNGVLSFLVSQKRREIAIRMALGARSRSVLKETVWQGMWPVVAGLLAGLIASFAVTRVLTAMLFEIRPADPLTFVACAAVLLIAGLTATVIPAHRASQVDPMVVLRHE